MFRQSKLRDLLILLIIALISWLQPLIVNGQNQAPKMGICTPQPLKSTNIIISSNDFESAKKLLISESKTASEAPSVFPIPQLFQDTYNKANKVQGTKGDKPYTIVITDRDAQIMAVALHSLGKINMAKGRKNQAEQSFKLAIVMLKDSKRLTDLSLYESDYVKSHKPSN